MQQPLELFIDNRQEVHGKLRTILIETLRGRREAGEVESSVGDGGLSL